MQGTLEARAQELEREIDQLADQLTDLKQEIRDADRRRYVQVTFSGSTTIYTYELRPGNPSVGIGDYVCVWSPMTNRPELVRVQKLGKGSRLAVYKKASRVHWDTTDFVVSPECR